MAEIDCKSFIRNAHELTESEADEIISGLISVQKARRADQRLSSFLKRAAAEQGDAAKMAALNEKLNAQRRIIKRKAAEDFIFGEGDPMENMEAFLVGRPGGIFKGDPRQGSLLSVDATIHALRDSTMGRMLNDLEEGHEGILRLLRDDQFSRDVAREMWHLPEGRGTVTGNADAYHAAQVFDKHKEALRLLANEEGANIRRLPGHVMGQHHDAAQVYKAGERSWIDYVLPKIDQERTFGTADPEEFLKEVYRSVVSGKPRLTKDAAVPQGPGALAKRLGRERVLHFKTVDDWLEYHDKFGGGRPVVSGIITSMQHLADEVGLMQRMGPNPDHMFDTLLRQAEDRARSAGKQVPGRTVQGLKNRYTVVSRKDVISGDATISRGIHGIKAVQNMSKLGSAFISSWADLSTAAATAKYAGVGFLDAYRGVFGRMVSTGASKAEQKRIARMLGVGFDGMLGSVARRFNASDIPDGTMARLSDQFFRASGLAWWTDTVKEGFALMMSRHLADSAGRAWGDLDDALRRTLGLYGIEEADWDVIRRSGVLESDEGRFVAPEAIREAGEATEIADKLQAYFVNEVDFASPTPGARERAIVMQGLQRGTVPGAVAELFLQFKMFPTTIITKHWPRMRQLGMPGAVMFATQMTLLGYGAMTVKDLLKGRSPRDTSDPSTWVSALLQGGGAGILGDLLFNDFRQYGRGLTQTLAGPTFGTFDDLARLYASAARGEDSAAQAWRILTSNMPYSNHFMLRTAIDYLFVYNIQEALNPGFLRRMERKIEREENQSFLLRPTDVISHGGGLR